MKDRLLGLSPEQSRHVRAAFLVFAVAFWGLVASCNEVPAAVAQDVDITQTTTPLSSPTETPNPFTYLDYLHSLATDWNENEGYVFGEEGLDAIKTIRQYDRSNYNVVNTDLYVLQLPNLCLNAPESPVCASAADILEDGFGIVRAEQDEELSHILVTKDEYVPREICGDYALGCVTKMVNNQANEPEPWLLMPEDNVDNYYGASFLGAHELFHYIAHADYDRHIVQNTSVAEDSPSCLMWFHKNVEMCQSLEGQEVTECSIYDFSELEAVVASRVYMIKHIDSQCSDEQYTSTQLSCSGGYDGMYIKDYDIPDYMPRQATIDAVNKIVDYFVANPSEYDLWITYKKNSSHVDAAEVLARAYSISDLVPKDRIIALTEVARSLRQYTTGSGYPLSDMYIDGRPVKEVCSIFE